MTSTLRKARMDEAADRDARCNWDAPFRPGDNLRVTRRISKAACPVATRHLDSLPTERREQLERDWQEHAIDPRPTRDSITDEIKARAAKEWADFD